MAQSVGGTVLEEPTPGSRRERRHGRPNRTRRRGVSPTDDGAAGPGARQERRLAAERRRFWLVLMPTVAVLLGLTVAVGALIRSDDRDAGGSGRGAGGGAGPRGPNTLLLSHRGADGRLDLLVLTGTNRQRAAILLLPTATQVEVPSLGPAGARRSPERR